VRAIDRDDLDDLLLAMEIRAERRELQEEFGSDADRAEAEIEAAKEELRRVNG